jgi:hypothetical protein
MTDYEDLNSIGERLRRSARTLRRIGTKLKPGSEQQPKPSSLGEDPRSPVKTETDREAHERQDKE